jgi:hypothetical protein
VRRRARPGTWRADEPRDLARAQRLPPDTGLVEGEAEEVEQHEEDVLAGHSGVRPSGHVHAGLVASITVYTLPVAPIEHEEHSALRNSGYLRRPRTEPSEIRLFNADPTRAPFIFTRASVSLPPPPPRTAPSPPRSRSVTAPPAAAGDKAPRAPACNAPNFAVNFFLFFTRQNSGVTFSFSFSPR